MNLEEIKFAKQRFDLVESLKNKGIKSDAVLEAIKKVPRHHFFDSMQHFAYKDQAFPIAMGQTISQPFTVAYQTELLEVKSNEKILEIGTGSGYQTAILCEMGANVHTMERIKTLHNWAQKKLIELGYKPYYYYGDGYKGLPSISPFDKILITAAASSIPKDLCKQLSIGGLMVIPIGNQISQKMTVIKKIDDVNFKIEEQGDFSFVPMLEGTE